MSDAIDSEIPVSLQKTRVRSVVHDATRLAALQATALLDSSPEQCFDNLTRLAAQTVAAPAAFLSLVDSSSDFFKSFFGFVELLPAGRRISGETFCHYALMNEGVLAINDAREDPTFRDVPTVKSHNIIAYLGVPLITRFGQPLGAFCVVDFKPRSWTGSDITTVLLCARAAMREIEARTSAPAVVPETSTEHTVASLSPREYEVLKRLVSGQQLKQIASDLTVSVKTIATHRVRMMRKLALRGNHDLFRFAVQQNLVDWR